ncbi:protein of unknown function [Candidatus Methylacidiphilum fumarolicum]|uniref:Uncharacterized protein n=1 Tax=Candidatus Methylacidiphilum fumarolicum TaxID=591154 RepID=A0ABN8XG17_9BACT|nr:protein of unknown function [Candidatus Methylacidiphilum fumarolicum]CAI9086196.1 protein of unknown function [Candidatus Methylacidiphilum fumarolicum]
MPGIDEWILSRLFASEEIRVSNNVFDFNARLLSLFIVSFLNYDTGIVKCLRL